MLRQILDQMQFKVEGTGGGCEVMALYVHNHAVIVSIDAHINFGIVTPDNEISVGVYAGGSAYNWGDDNMVDIKLSDTQSGAINYVIEAIVLAKKLDGQRGSKLENALSEVWNLMLKRHGLGEVCAYEVQLEQLDAIPQKEVQAWLTLWDSVTDLAGWEAKIQNRTLQPKGNQGVE